MAVRKTNETARATTSFTIDGEEQDTPVLFEADYTFRGQKIFPTRVVADWLREDSRWLLRDVRVWGAVQKKNGSRGVTETERKAYEARMFRPEEGVWADDTPDWLMVAVMNNEPK